MKNKTTTRFSTVSLAFISFSVDPALAIYVGANEWSGIAGIARLFSTALGFSIGGQSFLQGKLSKFQQAAVALAILGVAHEIWQQGTIAWETLLVAFGYAAYFFLRRKLKTDHLGGFWWDIVLSLPVAFYYVSYLGTVPDGWSILNLLLVVTGLGLFSAIGLGSYILASRFLPMVLFGLLSYLEPILLALASLMIGETINPEDWWTYIPIWVAVLLLVVEGALHLWRQQRNTRMLKRNVAQYKKRYMKIEHEMKLLMNNACFLSIF